MLFVLALQSDPLELPRLTQDLGQVANDNMPKEGKTTRKTKAKATDGKKKKGTLHPRARAQRNG